MVNASEILKSPDYINANAATKLAIFEKHVASDENYANANPQTQRAIRAKFGVESGEGMPQERTTMQEIMQAPAGIYRGFKDVTDTLIKGGASAVDYLAGTNTRASVDEAAAQSARDYEQTYGKSTIAGGGRLAGNIVATAPVGAVVAAPLKAAGVAAPIVESIASSGFRTGLAPATGAARAIDLGLRGTGGAVTGGISAGLVNPEDTGMGAAVGAVIPTVVAPVVKQFAKGLGFAKDVVTGRAAEVRAAEIVRNTLGDQLEPAAAALSKARPGITAVQALQEAGINADPFMALGKLAEKMDTGTAYRLLRESQELAQTNQLAAMAGGGTQTTARESQNVARNALTDLTTPMRETELGAANTARNVRQRLEPTLGQRQASAQSALQLQGQLATDAAQQTNLSMGGAVSPRLGGSGVPQPVAGIVPGMPRLSPSITLNAERASEASKAAGEVGEIVKQRGAEAAFIQKQIDSLADYGLKPIDTSNIVSSITAKLNDPKIGPSDVNQAVLSKVINKIEEWTAKGGGVIDAEALYSIRKNAVGEEIARLYPNADAKQQARFAAKLLSEIKPAIDDAIVDAGGTGWRRYLQTYETGMKEIDQQKLAALALEKFKGSKEEFIKLVRGNNPDAVEDIFGPGSFNIFKEMGRKSGQLEDIANQLSRDIKVTEQATAGAGGLARIMGMSEKEIGRIPAFFSVTATTINKALDVLEGRVTNQVKQILVDGMKDGKSVAELIQKLPSKDRNVVLRTLMKSDKWNPEGVTAPVQLFVDRKNNLAPEQKNRNSLRP
jgi:hypothetical protein